MADSILERRPNESELEYHRRIIEGKLVDKTLSDYDYSELSRFAYGKEFCTDSARRMFYGSKRTLDYLANARIGLVDDPDVLSELDAKMVELRKERQKFYDQRRELSKIVSEDARREHLVDELCNAAKHLTSTVGLVYDKINCPITDATNIDSACDAVLVLSDWHYGMRTDNVFNTYNTDICRARVKTVVESAIKKMLLHKCTRLHIVVLGDLYHGAIHTSARVASEELVCEQLMQVSEILAQTIEVLSKFVNETIVYMTYGNHARTMPNKSESIHRDNMERIIPWWLEQRFASYRNIHIQEDSGSEFIFINACGHDICASHGDNDSVKSSPRLLSTMCYRQCGKNIEVVLLGDKHHRESFEELGVTAMLCGSLCGTDDYANEKRLYSSPSQLLLIMNKADGVDAEYRLRVN